jgi:hypothetical protein
MGAMPESAETNERYREFMTMRPANEEFSAWWKTLLALYVGLGWFWIDSGRMNLGDLVLIGLYLSLPMAFLAYMFSSIYLAIKNF